MPGIIHFDRISRGTRQVSRRSLMLGTAGLAGSAALGVLTASAQGLATPAATPGETKGPDTGLYKGTARERLKGLLSLIPPDLMGGPDPNSWLFTWTDLQTQLLAFGNPNLLDGSVPILPITQAIASDDPLIVRALMPEVKETFGFSPFEVHQILTTGALPDKVTFYKGGMPIDQLPAIWEAAGYEHKQGDAGEYWTVGEHAEQDLSSNVTLLGMSMLNNVAILDEDVVVFAPRIELLQAVQVLARDGGASAADEDAVAAAVGAIPSDAVSLIVVPGAGLDASTIVPENPGASQSQSLADLLAESDDAVGPMPVSDLAVFGVTAGATVPVPTDATPVVEGNPDSVIFVDIVTGSPEDAAQTAKVVAWRIENMTSPVAGYGYSELLTPVSRGEESTGSVATMTFTSPRTLAVWSQMLVQQDVWPFVYLKGE